MLRADELEAGAATVATFKDDDRLTARFLWTVQATKLANGDSAQARRRRAPTA